MFNKNTDKIKEKSIKNIINNYYPNTNDEDDKYMKYINENMDGVDIADLYEQEYKFDNDENMDDVDIADLYEQEYNFDNDESILDSFSRIYEKHDIKYKPQNNTKFIRVRPLKKIKR